jgi:hypothetical protein
MSNLSEKRYGLITGSKCHVLFPKRSAEVGQRTYAKQLAMAKYFKYSDEISTWQMEHGHYAENEAMEWFQSNIDPKAFKPDFISFEEWGGSADCLTENYGVDFKCPTTMEGWLDYLTDGISDQQYWQCQMYMFLYKKPLWKICAFLTETFRMGENGDRYPIAEQNRMISIDVELDVTFEPRLREISPKIIEMRESFIKQFELHFNVPIVKQLSDTFNELDVNNADDTCPHTYED